PPTTADESANHPTTHAHQHPGQSHHHGRAPNHSPQADQAPKPPNQPQKKRSAHPSHTPTAKNHVTDPNLTPSPQSGHGTHNGLITSWATSDRRFHHLFCFLHLQLPGNQLRQEFVAVSR